MVIYYHLAPTLKLIKQIIGFETEMQATKFDDHRRANIGLVLKQLQPLENWKRPILEWMRLVLNSLPRLD